MAKKNPKIAAELEALLSYMDEDPDVAAAQPVEEAREELRAMGIDTGPAERMLKKLLDLAETAKARQNDGDDITLDASRSVQSHLAFAASDGDVQPHAARPGFFPLGSISIDGVEREVQTDGLRVAIFLGADERQEGLWIDDLRVEIQVSAGTNLAVLSGYMRADADLLLLEPTKHVLRWDTLADGGR
jgi:hypothetical protein